MAVLTQTRETMDTRRDFIRKMGLTLLSISSLPLISSTYSCRGQVSRPPEAAQGFEPGYLRLHRTGELKERAARLREKMASCTLCPRDCRARRLDGRKGFCGAADTLRVSSFNPHFGEERPLVGRHGSGTIFFSHCNLLCVFCINWPINHEGQGNDITTNRLADMMLRLQGMGCHNINVVTPTHYSAHILEALDMAAERGLRLPLTYNSSGWEHMEVLELLDGVVDIYLPDMKYYDSAMAAKYSAGAACYPEVTKRAIIEMNRQVGVAIPNSQGILERGMIIRHLVMPNNVGGSADVMRWIAGNLPKNTYVNIMSQYRPMHRAFEFPAISRGITREEYQHVIQAARAAGLTNLDIQGA